MEEISRAEEDVRDIILTQYEWKWKKDFKRGRRVYSGECVHVMDFITQLYIIRHLSWLLIERRMYISSFIVILH